MPSISIIVPTYNRAHLITRTIESVINQTSNNWELIIVDDGSTDNTAAIVNKYLSDKIRYFSQNNSGANKARNVGAKNARYSYLSFLDSDDELFPDWVESFERVLSTHPSIVCCGTNRIEEKKEFEVMPKSLGRIFEYSVGKFTNGASYVIDKNLFFEVGAFDEDLKSGQHTELSFRLADSIVSKRIRIANIFRPLVKIHVHGGPRIRNNSTSKFEGAYRMLQKHPVLLAKDPSLKSDYAKIVTLHAFKRKYWGIGIKSFFIFCKYSIIARLNK